MAQRTAYELSGSVTEKEKSFIETWENVTPGTHWVIRENRRGDEEPQVVAGPVKFRLSTYDRMLTQDKIRDIRNDPFLNGSFRPLIVPEDITIESNPNALSDEDIKRVFGSSKDAWEAYMDVIDSPSTIQRMIDLADEDEDTELSHKRYQQLVEMHASFSNVGKRLTVKDPEMQKQIDQMAGGSGGEPVGAPARRGPGRPRKDA